MRRQEVGVFLDLINERLSHRRSESLACTEINVTIIPRDWNDGTINCLRFQCKLHRELGMFLVRLIISLFPKVAVEFSSSRAVSDLLGSYNPELPSLPVDAER